MRFYVDFDFGPRLVPILSDVSCAGHPVASAEQCAALLFFDRRKLQANEAERLYDSLRRQKFSKKDYINEDSSRAVLREYQARLKDAARKCLDVGALLEFPAGAGKGMQLAVQMVRERCPEEYAAAATSLRPIPPGLQA